MSYKQHGLTMLAFNEKGFILVHGEANTYFREKRILYKSVGHEGSTLMWGEERDLTTDEAREIIAEDLKSLNTVVAQ